MKIENIYTFGNAEVSVGAGIETQSKSPFLSIAKIERQKQIGFDLLENPTEEKEMIILSFKNLEGFKVFKRSMKLVEIELNKLEKLKTK